MLASQLKPYPLLPLQSVWESNWGTWAHRLHLWWQTVYRGFGSWKFRTTRETWCEENLSPPPQAFVMWIGTQHHIPACPRQKAGGQGLPQGQTLPRHVCRPSSGKEGGQGRDVSVPRRCSLSKPQTFHSHRSPWQLQLPFQFLGKTINMF